MIIVRVTEEKFEKLIKECFGKPNPLSDAEKTMLHAIATSKIQYGEIKINGTRIGKIFKGQLKEAIGGLEIDFSIIKANGPFDKGPFLYL